MGREGEATGKSCIQDGGSINGGFPGTSQTGPQGSVNQLSMKKIISPEQNCRQNVIFFEESGLGQHYRVIHEKYATAEVVAKARTKTWEIYGRETLHFIFTISEWKSKVSI